jgi:RHS repeat-associated protein
MRIPAFLTAAVLLPGLAGAADVLRVTSRTYDPLDRIETETVGLENGGTASVRYSYYDDGRRRTVTDAFGRVTFYEYDGRGNLKRVTANQGLPDQHVTAYEYWPDNLLRSLTRANGTVTSYEYDRADRLTSVVVRRDALVLASYEYTYDANGNRLTQVETNGGAPEPTSYTYDALNRLETVSYPDGTSAAYEYDAVGNRTREVLRSSLGAIVSDKTAAFDAINRLSSITDPVDPSLNAALTYDRNGNLLAKTTATGVESYEYDARDLLAETQSGSSISGRYAYDPFGRRYVKIGLEGVRQYLYDETSTLHELDGDDLEVAKYEYGGDSLLSFVRRDEPRRFDHQDALGSVVALSDSSGSVVARYHLDAWGRYRVPSELSASANRFGFTGYLFDQETDLYYAKARFYDPEIGRFTSQDSYLGKIDEPPTLHRYVYAHANPTRFVDPTGHCVGRECQDETIDRMSPVARAAYQERTTQTEANLWGGIQGVGLTLGRTGLGVLQTLGEGVRVPWTPDPATVAQTALFFTDAKGALQQRYTDMQAEVAQRESAGDHVGAGRAASSIVSNDALIVLSAAEGGWAGARGLARFGRAFAVEDVALTAPKNAPLPATALEGVSQALPDTPPRGTAGGQQMTAGPLRGATTGRALVTPESSTASGGSGLPARPSWQAAQAGPAADLAGFGFEAEPSYLNGQRVPYGTPGSVRPDYASELVKLSVDVKNYDVTTAQGRWRLVNDVVGQAEKRASNLPEGMRQGVRIDLRGQQLSDKLLQGMLNRIVKKSDGRIQPDNIDVLR